VNSAIKNILIVQIFEFM